MSSSAGTKVTSDPASKQPITEGTGVITSDSLAGESIASGGAFATKNPEAGRLDQPSKGTTTNTKDTSGATRLDPAVDAEAREASEAWDENAMLNAGKGLGKEAGRGPTYATTAGATSIGSGGNVEAAPSYVGDPYVGEEHLKPKGKNLTEGGFDSDAPNASFNTDIGGKNDPSRVAEQRLQNADANPGAYAGTQGGREKGVTGQGTYDTLGEEQA